MAEAGPKRLVLLVEGHGDVQAVPALVDRLLKERQPWDQLFLDRNAIRIGGVETLVGSDKNRGEWLRWLGVAALRRRIGAVLAILDGDAGAVEGRVFCAALVAKVLAERSRAARGGELFSVACVFARQEFESWLIAGVDSLAGRALPDGRQGIRAGTSSADLDTETAPRDAKRWLSKRMVNGYKPTQDQAMLAEIVDLNAIRARNLRSFRRLESALDTLIDAVRNGQPVISPR
ncbi:MAG: DUF4276 family protein [Tepidisphaerales bacterium]